jgi:hypothetical protein
MPNLDFSFNCPHCGAKYNVVRIESPVEISTKEITCLGCGGPLQARQGAHVLKYFLIERPGRRASREPLRRAVRAAQLRIRPKRAERRLEMKSTHD